MSAPPPCPEICPGFVTWPQLWLSQFGVSTKALQLEERQYSGNRPGLTFQAFYTAVGEHLITLQVRELGAGLQ